MKKINATFNVENDLAEYNLRKILEGLGAKYVRTLPNTDHLKDNKHYIELYKVEKKAKETTLKFINDNR